MEPPLEPNPTNNYSGLFYFRRICICIFVRNARQLPTARVRVFNKLGACAYVADPRGRESQSSYYPDTTTFRTEPSVGVRVCVHVGVHVRVRVPLAKLV